MHHRATIRQLANYISTGLLRSSSLNAPLKYWLINASACSAQFLFFMVLKMHLAKVIVAVVAMPTGNGVTDYTLPYGFVVVVVFSLFCRRWFLLFWLCLHMPYASEG